MRLGLILWLVFSWVQTSASAPEFPKGSLPVAFYQQKTDYGCGAAALLAVLRYWQVYRGSERALYPLLGTDADSGTQWTEIHKVARHFGLVSKVTENTSIEELRKSLAEGKTVILEIQAWTDDTSPHHRWDNDWIDGHYTTLVGMDSEYAYFMDSSSDGPYIYVTINELMKRWHNWAVGFDGVERKYQRVALHLMGKTHGPSHFQFPVPIAPLE